LRRRKFDFESALLSHGLNFADYAERLQWVESGHPTNGRNGSKSVAASLDGKRTLAWVALAPMPMGPSVKLSVLRDIAWDVWDPIGLNGSEGGWRQSDAADEYDRYMRRVAKGLHDGERNETLVDYLISIETVHMGLTETSTSRKRAGAAVAAVLKQLKSTD
jgi:hypothetical protein